MRLGEGNVGSQRNTAGSLDTGGGGVEEFYNGEMLEEFLINCLFFSFHKPLWHFHWNIFYNFKGKEEQKEFSSLVRNTQQVISV